MKRQAPLKSSPLSFFVTAVTLISFTATAMGTPEKTAAKKVEKVLKKTSKKATPEEAKNAFTKPVVTSPTQGETKTTAPKAVEKTVDLFDYRDPETKVLYKFQYQPATREELEKFKPSKLRMQSSLPSKPGATDVVAKFVMRDFPVELMAFTIAQGLSLAIHLENDPAFAKSFAEANASAAGVISFAGFVANSRAANAVLRAFGVAYDPRRAPLDYRIQPGMLKPSDADIADDFAKMLAGETPRPRLDYLNSKILKVPQPPTSTQRMLAPLLGPVGLTAGMLASNVIHEVMADENLKHCVQARYGTVDPKTRKFLLANHEKFTGTTDEVKAAKAEYFAEKADEACDKAWEDWAMDKKMGDYTPDLISMSAASLILAGITMGSKWTAKTGVKYALEKKGVDLVRDQALGRIVPRAMTHNAERYIPVVLRGIRTAGSIGSWMSGPYGRFIMTIGHIWAFMEVVHPITPAIKKPWETYRQGNDITGRIDEVWRELDRAERNNWVWEPRPDSDFCTTVEMDVMGNPNPGMNTCQAPEQPAPDFLLKKMAERQAKWREFILQDSYLAHTSWQGYISRFATIYANATSFYKMVVSHINWYRFDPATGHASKFYQKSPLYGLYTDPENRTDDGAKAAIRQAAEWLEKYIAGRDLKIRNDGSYTVPYRELVELPKILTGLRAGDPNVSLESLGVNELSQITWVKKEETRKNLEKSIRDRLQYEAVQRLTDVLDRDPNFNDRRFRRDEASYRRAAERNPFMQLRLKLGSPEPLGVGVEFVRKANDIDSLIVQDNNEDHPDSIGNVRTATMADYLTVSMVCGPDADPQFTENGRNRIAQEVRDIRSQFSQAWNMAGIHVAEDASPWSMLTVDEHVRHTTGPDQSWFNIFNRNATITEWKGVRASFRPPRLVDGFNHVCTTRPDNAREDAFWDPYKSKWTIDGETYNGIIDIIQKKIRPELIGNALFSGNASDKSPFDVWWEKRVDTHIAPTVEKFRKNYVSIVSDKFLPALMKNGADDVKMYNNRPIKLGALAALNDEADLYFLILTKTARVLKEPKERDQMNLLTTNVKMNFKALTEYVADANKTLQAGKVVQLPFEKKLNDLRESIAALQAYVKEREAKVRADENVKKANAQVFKNLQALSGEMAKYWGVVRAVQVPGQ